MLTQISRAGHDTDRLAPLLQPAAARHDVEHAADLRRRHARALVERLVALATALSPSERALLEAVYRDGTTVTSLAVLRGEDPRALRRRVRRLVRRVMSPEFRFVVQHRADLTRARVAELCIIGGRSLRAAADELGLTLHAVRRHRDAISALAETAAAARRSSASRAG